MSRVDCLMMWRYIESRAALLQTGRTRKVLCLTVLHKWHPERLTSYHFTQL